MRWTRATARKCSSTIASSACSALRRLATQVRCPTALCMPHRCELGMVLVTRSWVLGTAGSAQWAQATSDGQALDNLQVDRKTSQGKRSGQRLSRGRGQQGLGHTCMALIVAPAPVLPTLAYNPSKLVSLPWDRWGLTRKWGVCQGGLGTQGCHSELEQEEPPSGQALSADLTEATTASLGWQEAVQGQDFRAS